MSTSDSTRSKTTLSYFPLRLYNLSKDRQTGKAPRRKTRGELSLEISEKNKPEDGTEREVCSQIKYREKAAAQNPQEGDPRKISFHSAPWVRCQGIQASAC